MTFTLEKLLDSVAGVLRAGYPDYPRYMSPNQQGTKTPCFFIFQMPGTIDMETGGHFMRDIGIDIIFVQKRNIVNGYEEILNVQDFLAEHFSIFHYSDGTETVYINTYEHRANIEDDELHYQFHIRERVRVENERIFMQEMEGNHAEIR